MIKRRILLSSAVLAGLGLGLVACDDDSDDSVAGSSAEVRLSSLSKLDQYESKSEIVAYDPATKAMFSIGADNTLSIVDISAPEAVSLLRTVDLSEYGDGAQSVAVSGSLVAVAVAPSDSAAGRGVVVFFDTSGVHLQTVRAGYLPDMVTFSEDGALAIVANEGEPSGDYKTDPEGSIGIIDTNDFSYTELPLNGALTAAADGTAVRLGGTPSADQAKDLEPEYIAVSGDYAYVTLQENNALAKVNLASKTVELIKSLGVKSYAADSGNTIDIEEDGEIAMQSFDGLYGLYMPDSIASVDIAGSTYLLTANEGDGREYIYTSAAADEAACDAEDGDWDDENAACEVISFIDEEKISKLALADSIAAQFADHNDLKVVTDLGKNAAGEYEALYGYGARSFSVWDVDGDLVFDSGDETSRLIAQNAPDLFNQDEGEMDGRSGNKGGEPEALSTGQVGDRYYAFIGLERQSVILTYDITDPAAPTLVEYHDTGAEGNLSPEGMKFVSAEDSPNGQPLLLVAFEYGTDSAPQAVVVYQLVTESVQ
ncbi:choice-of-anchor I family protein [Granulosicoccaceae sp. 1_MG-2023]|nr:choice-of-anchor I family protein [Granulosicoccaceae sp. 1_MG-2023]